MLIAVVKLGNLCSFSATAPHRVSFFSGLAVYWLLRSSEA